MKVSNLTVNLAMRSRSSSKPKLMFGRESAIEGAFAEASGARIVLVESEGSNIVDMFCRIVWMQYYIWLLDLVRDVFEFAISVPQSGIPSSFVMISRLLAGQQGN